MFPLVSVWVRQQGAWKLHPYNFVIQNCLLTVILTKPDKFEATNCYCHPCIYNSLLILTTAPQHCHVASTNSFLHLFHSSLQQKKQSKHPHTGSTPQHFSTCSLRYFCSTFYPFFAYPVLNFFLQPHYPTGSFPQTCMCYCLGDEISTYLVKSPGQCEFDALQIITLAPSTPFATHRLATSLFSVSRDLPSGNDIGLHTLRLLLTFDLWFLLLVRCILKTYFVLPHLGKLCSHSACCMIYFSNYFISHEC